MKIYEIIRENIEIDQEMDEASIKVSGDIYTLFSLLGEMSALYGEGGPTSINSSMRDAIKHIYENSGAQWVSNQEKPKGVKGSTFMGEVAFRLGSIRSAWMASRSGGRSTVNWNNLKICFKRLSNDSRYRKVEELATLADFSLSLNPEANREQQSTLSNYFELVMKSVGPVLLAIYKLETDSEIKEKAMKLSQRVDNRHKQFGIFKDHWVREYANELRSQNKDSSINKPRDELKGKQAVASNDIVSQVLAALPPKVKASIEQQGIHRMGSQNEKLMFLMKELPKRGIDPNSLLKEFVES